MASQELIEAGALTIDEHVRVILECRERVKTATFEFVDAIRSANRDLGPDVFQNELAKLLGMTGSTLSRWLTIGNSEIIKNNLTSVPVAFSSLYEIARLENEYVKKYPIDGLKKLQNLFNRRSISDKSEQSDIKALVTKVRSDERDIKSNSKQDRVIELNAGDGYIQQDKISTLNKLIISGTLFRTFFLIPPEKLLTKWSNDSVLLNDIHEELPIADLRGMSSVESISCFIQVPPKRLNSGIKILQACGFSYRNIFIPPLINSHFNLIEGKNILVFGQRGAGSFTSFKHISDSDIDSTLTFIESISSGPNLLLFSKTDRSFWTSVIEPIENV